MKPTRLTGSTILGGSPPGSQGPEPRSIQTLRTQREIIDSHAVLGDDSTSSGIERLRALEELGKHATGDPRAEIMEGLFLRNSRQYLGLFRVLNESEAVVGGLDTPICVGHDRCSAWRRLAWGVGQWIKSQREGATPSN